jgi:hypothetical protein
MSDLWGSFRSRKGRCEYAEKVANSLHRRLQTPKIEFPLFISRHPRLSRLTSFDAFGVLGDLISNLIVLILPEREGAFG